MTNIFLCLQERLYVKHLWQTLLNLDLESLLQKMCEVQFSIKEELVSYILIAVHTCSILTEVKPCLRLVGKQEDQLSLRDHMLGCQPHKLVGQMHGFEIFAFTEFCDLETQVMGHSCHWKWHFVEEVVQCSETVLCCAVKAAMHHNTRPEFDPYWNLQPVELTLKQCRVLVLPHQEHQPNRHIMDWLWTM